MIVKGDRPDSKIIRSGEGCLFYQPFFQPSFRSFPRSNFFMTTRFSQAALIVAMTGLMGGAIVSPAHAASIDFNTWTSSPSGITTTGVGSATLFTNSLTNPNSTDAAVNPDLQTFLGLANKALDISVIEQAFQGSALRTSFNAGDSISFDYDFDLFGSDLDYAFVVVDDMVEKLSLPAGTYTKTFTTAGLFGIGVVDIKDIDGASSLSISNADFKAVPTPALLPGLVGLGVSMLRRRKGDS
jgi:hypothetical protein